MYKRQVASKATSGIHGMRISLSVCYARGAIRKFCSMNLNSILINEPHREKICLRDCLNIGIIDQPVMSVAFLGSKKCFSMRRLEFKDVSCAQRWLWSDCTDAQSDQSRRWEHMVQKYFSFLFKCHSAYMNNSILIVWKIILNYT